MAAVQAGASSSSKSKPNGPRGKTVYVRNLHDRVKPKDMATALRSLFEEYGSIVDIVSRSNLKAKGQAFIVYDNEESAAKAIQDIDGFTLFDKSISCAFAQTRSDATVAQEGSSAELEEHKKTRQAEKERKKAREAQEAKKKRPPPSDVPDGAQQPPVKKGLKSTAASKAGVVPEEYLPPNKTLFIRNLPAEYDVDELTAVFQQYPGFKEFRPVPGNAGIAFVEYQNEEGAIQAKKATGDMPFGGNTIKVFFQRS